MTGVAIATLEAQKFPGDPVSIGLAKDLIELRKKKAAADAADASKDVKPLYDMLGLWNLQGVVEDPLSDFAYATKTETLIHSWAINKGLPLSLYQPGRSPITPAEAPLEASNTIDRALALVTVLNSIGVVAEAASLGQVESVIWAMTNIINLTGLPGIVGDLYGTPTRIGLKIPLERAMNRKYQPRIPPDQVLSDLRSRGMLEKDPYDLWMSEQGFPAWAAEMIAYAKTRFPGFRDLLTLFQRGYIEAGTFRTWLRRTGLHPDVVAPLEELRWQIPGYQDIISVYMREGYLEEKWAEIPTEFIQYMEKLGYDGFWALRLWGKHWILPSVTLLYDMFHKGIIDFDTMSLMLRYHDFEPVWRHRLIENAYNMIPRVDLRRAYRYGQLSAEDLAQRYRWLGYKPGDDKIMAEIATHYPLDRYYTQIETQARALFKEGLMNEAEFRGWLRKSGLPEEAIDLAVDAEHLAYRLDYAKDLITLAKEAYRKDVWTLEEFEDRLLYYGLQHERVKALSALEQLRKIPKPKPGAA